MLHISSLSRRALLVVVLLLLHVHAWSAAKQPNVVFILADDLGWADLGCYGSTFHETPALDELAQDGMRFTSFYSAGSVCSPTRSSIMTGKYPVRTGITDWIPGQAAKNTILEQLRPANRLALEEVTFAETFKAAGYRTFYTGKWHLGGKGYSPREQGFEEYVGDEESEESDAPAPGKKQQAKLKRRLESTAVFTRAALEFLERTNSRPFLLFLSYHDVHTPIQPVPSLVERYEVKAKQLRGSTPTRREHEGITPLRQENPAYASMVAAVDQSVGVIRAKLEKLGLSENTILVFTSDNGGLATRRTPGPTSNEPLRAGKGWLYEGGIRVPLLIAWPGHVKPGATSTTPLISTDFYPTLLELSGQQLRPAQHLDGVSFARLLQGGDAPDRRKLFWHYPHYHGSTWTPGAAIRDGEWKLIHFFESDTCELYNLEADFRETRDVSAENPKQTQELLSSLRQWQEKVGARIPRRLAGDN